MTSLVKRVVVDASYILSLLLPDENLDPTSVPSHMFAPTLLPYEVANGLRSATSSKRITLKLATALYQEFNKLPITYKTIDFSQVLKLAIQVKLSVYDASYLLLSRDKNLPLKTYDKQLLKLTKLI